MYYFTLKVLSLYNKFVILSIKYYFYRSIENRPDVFFALINPKL